MNWFGRNPRDVVVAEERNQIDPEEVRQVLETHGGKVDVVVAKDRVVAVSLEWARYHGLMQA